MRSTLLNQGAFAKVRASTTTRSSLLLIVALFFCSSLVENCKAFQAPPLLAINNKNSILQVQPQGIPTQPVSSLKISRGDEESINPNDLETPEERKRRMEMVRQVQKSFYGQVNVRGERHMSVKSEKTSTVLKNVPLWRVQWTELPGYQNILNCHVAHYTHMFHSILAGPKPWYFGHVFLPEGSKNLENPDYHLVKNDGDESEHPKSKAAYIGVLMQVTDYEQLDDGRLALVVQALERFRVIEATQHEPYAVATVQLLPDIELALPHFREAQKMAKELSDDFLDEKDAWGAACAAAVETAEQIRGFEYRPVSVHESSNGLVAPLVNFDMDADVEKYFPRNIKEVESRRSKVKNVMEQHLLSASPLDVPDNLEKIDTEHVLQLEHEVWLEVDTLIKLLHQLNPNSNQEAQITPIPTQILGLLPRESNGHSEGTCAWPDDFQLDQYAKRLEDYANSMTVGTYSKSPFVRYDYAANTKSPYPSLRRAQRLSFVVWVLLENIAILGDEDENVATKLLSRQEILELGSITERLEAAKTRLDAINQALKIVAGR